MNIKEIEKKANIPAGRWLRLRPKEQVDLLLTHIKDLEAEGEADKEIQQELIDSINERGEKVQALMKSCEKDWVGIYDVADDGDETYHITDNKSGLDLQDNAIIVYIVELEAENKRLREEMRNHAKTVDNVFTGEEDDMQLLEVLTFLVLEGEKYMKPLTPDDIRQREKDALSKDSHE